MFRRCKANTQTHQCTCSQVDRVNSHSFQLKERKSLQGIRLDSKWRDLGKHNQQDIERRIRSTRNSLMLGMVQGGRNRLCHQLLLCSQASLVAFGFGLSLRSTKHPRKIRPDLSVRSKKRRRTLEGTTSSTDILHQKRSRSTSQMDK
jgi:hypothetical protein